MAEIPSITEGMTWAQAFGIINKLIAAVNALNGAVGGALVDGKIDYNSIVNRPKINGVELVGDLTQAQLSISLDSGTIEKINSFDERVGGVENSLTQRVTLNELSNALQQYAKKADLPDISNLATKTELTSGLGEKVATSNFNTVLTQLNTAIGSKASAGDVPTVAQWQVLRSEMEAKVTQAGNSASSAARAASAAVEEAIQDLPDNTTIQLIVSKVNEIVTRSNTLSAAECGSAPLDKCLNPVQQLVIDQKI